MRAAIVLLVLAILYLGGMRAEQAAAQSVVKGEEGTTIVLGRYGKDDDDEDPDDIGDDVGDEDGDDRDDDDDDDDENDDDDDDDDGDDDDDDDDDDGEGYD